MLKPATVIASLCLLAPLEMRAQAVDPDAGEVSALGGASTGSGTHAAISAAAGIGFSRYGMGLFSITFMPLGDHTIQGWPVRTSLTKSLVYDFGADFHVRIPMGERWSPYAIAGAGLLWNTVRANTIDPFGVQFVRHYDQFNGALHTGAGVRYYVKKDWGIRPEVRVVVSKQTYTQFLFGIFYVTPPNWP